MTGILDQIQHFNVAIWCDTDIGCRTTLFNLIRACKDVAGTLVYVRFGGFGWDKTGACTNGQRLHGTFSYGMPVEELIGRMVKLTSQTHSETLSIPEDT